MARTEDELIYKDSETADEPGCANVGNDVSDASYVDQHSDDADLRLRTIKYIISRLRLFYQTSCSP